MVAAVKLAAAPMVGAIGFLASASSPNLSSIGVIFGVAVLFGGVAIVARYREALAVSEKERALYRERDVRITQENHTLTERVHELEARPNLASHAALLKEMSDNLRDHNRASQEENKARQQRDERIILLLDMICERQGIAA